VEGATDAYCFLFSVFVYTWNSLCNIEQRLRVSWYDRLVSYILYLYYRIGFIASIGYIHSKLEARVE